MFLGQKNSFPTNYTYSLLQHLYAYLWIHSECTHIKPTPILVM